MAIFVGTAGWSIRHEHADMFSAGPNHLARYAGRFSGVEINSSFYRPHRATTYAGWAASVPTGFRFSVKLPRTITHDARLGQPEALLDVFLSQLDSLGGKLGPLLMQLPPSLTYDAPVVERFLESLRLRFSGDVVCEPRHASWFKADAEKLLASFEIARAAADPAPHPGAQDPGGWNGICYFRWHGSPVMYRSNYGTCALHNLATQVKNGDAASRWCIFDNTANGAAIPNALALTKMLQV